MQSAYALVQADRNVSMEAAHGKSRLRPSAVGLEQPSFNRFPGLGGFKNGSGDCCSEHVSLLRMMPWRRPPEVQGNVAVKNGPCGCGGACSTCATKMGNSGDNRQNAGAAVAAVTVAAAAGSAATCPAAQRAGKATACIQPVVIAKDDGSDPTTAPSFSKVKSIWKKCCIDYSIRAAKTVKKTSFRTLDESPSNTPTAEESALFAAAGSSSCIQVFVPVEFAQNGTTGKMISGGGGTYDVGTAHPKIVLVEGASPEVVAHEVGHASGYGEHDSNNTVMKPTGAYNVANSTDISSAVCATARTGAVLTIAAGTDCCQKLK